MNITSDKPARMIFLARACVTGVQYPDLEQEFRRRENSHAHYPWLTVSGGGGSRIQYGSAVIRKENFAKVWRHFPIVGRGRRISQQVADGHAPRRQYLPHSR
jgi:hypothetical protein